MDTKKCRVEHGAMVEVPAYETHARGTNWLAKISPNPSAPGGLDRDFVERARGKYYYMITDLKPGTPIEFGADYRTAGGHKRPNRWYGVVGWIASDSIEFVEADNSDEAFSLAEEMQGALPGARRAVLEEERAALMTRLAEIDEEIEEIIIPACL